MNWLLVLGGAIGVPLGVCLSRMFRLRSERLLWLERRVLELERKAGA